MGASKTDTVLDLVRQAGVLRPRERIWSTSGLRKVIMPP